MRKHSITAALFMAMAAASVKAMAPLSITCEAKDGKAMIRLVGRITDWQNSADEFQQKVDSLVNAGVRDAHVYIRTQGGNVFEANEISNILDKFPGNITGSGGSMVASAGTAIAIRLKSFTMAKNGMWMYHKPSALLEGNEDQVASELKALKDLTNQYRTLYAEKTGLKEEEIEKRWAKGDVWLTAQEAKDQGFIDGITDAEELPEEDVKAMTEMGAPKDKLKIAASAAPTKQPTMTIEAMRAALGMPATATEAEITARANELRTAEANAKTAEQARRTAEVKALIDKAITEKRITEAHRKGFEAKFSADFDATKAELEAIAPVVSMAAAAAPAAAAAEVATKGREAWDYDKWAINDMKGLTALMRSDKQEDKDKFTALYEAKYGRKPELK